MKKVIKLFAIIFAILLFACGCENNTVDNKDDEKGPKLELNEDYSEIGLREEVVIEYTISGGVEASNEFSSSDETIATVDDFGYVKGKKVGEVTITVTVNLMDGTVLTKEINARVVDKTVYKVQFQLAGGSCSVEYGEVRVGETYVLPIPTKERAEFIGWTMSGVTGYITKIENVTGNVTVRANWVNYYTVTYELNGGTYEKTTEEVKDGTAITLGTPTKEGNKFLGWGLTKVSKSYITSLPNVNSNCTIYAQWEPAPIDITFDLDGGYYNGPRHVTYGSNLNLTSAQKAGYQFLGWSYVKGDTNYVTKLENVKEAKTLYANFKSDSTHVDCIITNLPEVGLPYDEQYQLKYVLYPSSSSSVTFSTTDTTILTVSQKGLVKTLRPGVATITVKVSGNETLTHTIEVVVYKPGRFEVSYETNSYMAIGESVNVNTKYIKNNGAEAALSYMSLDPTIASVDNNGNITGKAKGTATIRAYVTDNDSLYFDYLVTVVDENISDALKLILDSHESNIFTRYNLGIGAGSPEYYMDIIGSVSDLLFKDLVINREYYDKLPSGTKNHGPMDSIEFITVHYTGNMKSGADADNNVSYFNNLDYKASIHYVTGRSDKFGNNGYDSYQAFAGLKEEYGGWHASTGTPISWDKTGVLVKDGDPEIPNISISSNKKYTINGIETKISVPTLPDGYTLEGANIIVNGQKYTAINKMGLITKVVNGEYYLGRTWWGTQRSPYALCTYGGNKNSIGIESCVDQGSDLWHTWQVTAQLVADIMERRNLGIDRVVGHHFFSAKDCPQPMLENNMEIWYKFIEMVKAEYKKNTEFKDYTFKFEQVSGFGAEGVRVSQVNKAKSVVYKVTITKGSQKQEITLSSVINGTYSK